MTKRAVARTSARIADDLIKGVRLIALEIGFSENLTYDLLQKGSLPAAKVGGQWVASRAVLKEHFAVLTRGNHS